MGLISSIAVSHYIAKAALEQSVWNDAQGSLRDLTDIIAVVVDNAQTDADLLSNTGMVREQLLHSEAQEDDKHALKNTLLSLLAKKTYYDAVDILDKEGMVVVSTDAEPVTASLKECDYFMAAMSGTNNYIGEPIRGLPVGRACWLWQRLSCQAASRSVWCLLLSICEDSAISTAQKAALLTYESVVKRKRLQYVSARWFLIGIALRLAKIFR